MTANVVDTKLNEKMIQALLLQLLKTEEEEEVAKILESHGLLDESFWQPLGGYYSNYAVVGNQADNPTSALVEKIVNSIDAVLMNECLVRKIQLDGPSAPQTMREAVNKFFSIEDGDLLKIDNKERIKLAERVGVVATGGTFPYPSISCFDSGCGQNPSEFERTFLSLPGTKKNASKEGIPFVQGLFNMGGSGVLNYCGKRGNNYSFVLILSKRNPDLADADGKWGFTIIRKVPNPKEHSSTVYMYLSINGNVPVFTAESLQILPDEYPECYKKSMKFGTYIKLYNYQLERPSIFNTETLYDLHFHLFNPALPIMLYERRPKYAKSRGHETTMHGQYARLHEARDIFEENFPKTCSLVVEDIGTVDVTVYALKKEHRDSHYHGKEAVMYTINGQTHNSRTISFLNSDKVNKSYCSKDLQVEVNFDKVPNNIREILFMPGRVHERRSKLFKEFDDQLQDFLRNHPELIELEERRRAEALKDIKTPKGFSEILEKLIKNSATFSELFGQGSDVTSTLDFDYKLDKKHDYIPSIPPTFFRIKNNVSEFEVPIKQRLNVTIQTDAPNDYFERVSGGGLGPYIIPKSISHHHNLHNGIMRLNVKPSKRSKVGDEVEIIIRIKDKSLKEPFILKFKLRIVKSKEKPPIIIDTEENTKNNDDTSEEIENEKKSDNYGRVKVEHNHGEPHPSFSLPNIIHVDETHSAWQEYDFDDGTGVHIVSDGGNYDFYVNMKNKYYLTERDKVKVEDLEVVTNQYVYGLVLQCLAMVYVIKAKRPTQDTTEVLDIVNLASRGIAMSVVSIIKTLGSNIPKK